MTAELSIDWGESSIRIRSSIADFEDIQPLPADRQNVVAIASLIQDAMQATGSRRVGIVLRTREYFTRRLELNLDSADNVREVLQLQALAQFPDSYQDLTFEAIQRDQSNTFLLFALPTKSLEIYRSVADAAGAKLSFVAPAECDTLQLINQTECNAKTCLALTVDHEQRHLDLISDGVLTRVSSQPLDASLTAIQRDCKRAMLSSTKPIDCMICSDEAMDKAELEQFGLPVIRQASGVMSSPNADFLNSSLTERQRNSHLGWILAAAVGLIAVVCWSWNGFTRIAQQQAQISQLNEDKRRLLSELEHASNILAADQAIASWQSQNVNLLNRLSGISTRVPAHEQVHLDAVAFFTGSEDSPPTLQLSGRAKSVGQVLELNQQLAAIDGISLAPSGIREGQQDSSYPHVFDLEMSLTGKGEDNDQ